MIGLENLTPELATDLIELVNNLKKLPKTSTVDYQVKNRTGGYSRKSFSYVPLDDILEKIKENPNFAFMQPIGFDKESGIVGVKCVLIHKTGKYLESNVFPIKTTEEMKIQDEGAEITYRKRYAAGAFFGLATEEDTDGNDADAEPVEKTTKTPAKPATKPETPKKPTTTCLASQVQAIKELYNEEEIERALAIVKKNDLGDLSVEEASELIKQRRKA